VGYFLSFGNSSACVEPIGAIGPSRLPPVVARWRHGVGERVQCHADEPDADEGEGMTQPGGNRRIDRVLAAGFLDRLHEVSIEELRSMRADAEQEETDLSYLRRLLQGRIDILRAELARRAGGEGASLIDLLPGILADDAGQASPHGLGRHAANEPSRADLHRRQVESLVADVDLSDPSGHDDESLNRVLEVLRREEAEVSANRRSVQEVMDKCSAEITRRYRDGDADVADLLPSESN
jgi:hypothetical protein